MSSGDSILESWHNRIKTLCHQKSMSIEKCILALGKEAEFFSNLHNAPNQKAEYLRIARQKKYYALWHSFKEWNENSRDFDVTELIEDSLIEPQQELVTPPKIMSNSESFEQIEIPEIQEVVASPEESQVAVPPAAKFQQMNEVMHCVECKENPVNRSCKLKMCLNCCKLDSKMYSNISHATKSECGKYSMESICRYG